MNLRILKKLSKRSAPLLARLGDHREQFPAISSDNYTGMTGFPRKHWSRFRTLHDHPFPGVIKTPARDGCGFIVMLEPPHPRKGTVMVGGVSGYYEPEWDEENAWEAFQGLVHCHFTDWRHDVPVPIRSLRTPTEIFDAATDMLAELEHSA